MPKYSKYYYPGESGGPSYGEIMADAMNKYILQPARERKAHERQLELIEKRAGPTLEEKAEYEKGLIRERGEQARLKEGARVKQKQSAEQVKADELKKSQKIAHTSKITKEVNRLAQRNVSFEKQKQYIDEASKGAEIPQLFPNIGEIKNQKFFGVSLTGIKDTQVRFINSLSDADLKPFLKERTSRERDVMEKSGEISDRVKSAIRGSKDSQDEDLLIKKLLEE